VGELEDKLNSRTTGVWSRLKTITSPVEADVKNGEEGKDYDGYPR